MTKYFHGIYRENDLESNNHEAQAYVATSDEVEEVDSSFVFYEFPVKNEGNEEAWKDEEQIHAHISLSC